MLLLEQISFNPPRTQHLSPFKQHPGTPLLVGGGGRRA